MLVTVVRSGVAPKPPFPIKTDKKLEKPGNQDPINHPYSWVCLTCTTIRERWLVWQWGWWWRVLPVPILGSDEMSNLKKLMMMVLCPAIDRPWSSGSFLLHDVGLINENDKVQVFEISLCRRMECRIHMQGLDKLCFPIPMCVLSVPSETFWANQKMNRASVWGPMELLSLKANEFSLKRHDNFFEGQTLTTLFPSSTFTTIEVR